MSDQEKLEILLQDGTIDSVVGQLQSGKEAVLYAVMKEGELIAAKVYKDRDLRSFKNNVGYTEGRKLRNSRDQRAVERGSKHGKATQEAAWKTAESEALQKLHAGGVRVPRPIAFYEGVVLMGLVTDARGEVAPRMIDAKPPKEQARALHTLLVREIVKMLLVGYVHGDLSAYNILMGKDGPVIIDFPQAVSASHNALARNLLVRDVRNVTDFFAGLDPSLGKLGGTGDEIWRRYQAGDLDADFSPGAQAGEEDELTRQIAEATAMPTAVARAKGREERKRLVLERPDEEPAAERPRHERGGRGDRGPRRGDRGPRQERKPKQGQRAERGKRSERVRPEGAAHGQNRDRAPAEPGPARDRAPARDRGREDPGPRRDRGPSQDRGRDRGQPQDRGRDRGQPQDRGRDRGRGQESRHDRGARHDRLQAERESQIREHRERERQEREGAEPAERAHASHEPRPDRGPRHDPPRHDPPRHDPPRHDRGPRPDPPRRREPGPRHDDRGPASPPPLPGAKPLWGFLADRYGAERDEGREDAERT
jgi:RIO kinase 1